MEIRTAVLAVVLFSVAFGSSSDVPQHPATPTESSHEAIQPEFIYEPRDILILPNSQHPHMLCEAKFVSRLKFNCSGDLVPIKIYHRKKKHNITELFVDISHVKITPGDLNGHSCVCEATGYNGLVLRSRAATVKIAYLGKKFEISPSDDSRVPKNSLVALRCHPPSGLPSPNVSWLKDGDPLDTHRDGRLEVTNQAHFSLVLIKKAQTSDTGHYSCQASNHAGSRQSDAIRLKVYVDGGWSAWQEFSPCSAQCGNGTRTLKRSCTNPSPENGGHFCAGPSVKWEPCQDICPDVEIICPNHIIVSVNRSDIEPKIVSWNKPYIINKKNGTKFSIQVSPPWALPPVNLSAASAVYIITYVVKHEFGQTANCSFNITVLNSSAPACLTEDCKTIETLTPSKPSPGVSIEGKLSPITIGLIVAGIVTFLLVIIAFLSRFSKSRQMFETYNASTQVNGLELESFKRATLESTSPLIIHSSSYSELGPVVFREKLRAVSPTFEDEDSEIMQILPPCKEPPETKRAVHAEIVKPAAAEPVEVEVVNEQERDKERDYKRTNSSVSNKSTASEISRMMWNISNLPENADPKMVAWGLVDHNGGKFTIGDTGVSLVVPPQAIPEGHTEGIFIAIMNQEKEHPQITSKESLLSPVVKCGPNGLKFKRPVILSLPHCALLEEGAWNLKVQYNESEPGTPADWKQLIDVNKQDGSEPYLALVKPNMVHLMIDHFTGFAVIGESAPNAHAPKKVQIVAYVTPPEADADCVVRVYCIGDTPAHWETLHREETERLGGVTIERPHAFNFRDEGGDLLVDRKTHHPGWTNTSRDRKKIRFQHIWEGIERMPHCTFIFSLADKNVRQFRATFEVKQDREDGDEQEVMVSTATKQTPTPSIQKKSESSNKAPTEQSCTCAASTSLPKAASEPCLEDITAAILHSGSVGNHWHSASQANIVLGACAGSPAGSPLQLNHTSSGYFSFGFEPLPSMDLLTRKIRNELILILDPPHPKGDWRTLAEGLGFEMKHIRWLASKSVSPTDILLSTIESLECPLRLLADKLHEIGREDAASLIEAQMIVRETDV